MPAGASARALLVLALLQGDLASLVPEPRVVSVARDYGASSAFLNVSVTSDAAAPQDLSASIRFASSGARRLSRASPAGRRARRLRPEGPRPNGRRLLLGWRPPAGGGAGHARRLRAAEAALAAEGAELKVLDNVGVAVLSGGWRAARRLRTALPGVIDFVESDRVVRAGQAATTFSDPLASEQWALRAIRQADALQALGPALAAQGRETVVAVADSGIDTDHVDLAPRLWRNPGEVSRNGVDDDGNGFVDDDIGWNFARGVPDVEDTDGHGTHCAGIVAAVADNGRGVVGVAAGANVRIMPLKFVQSGGGLMSDAIGALEYALQNGAEVSSHSFGGPDHSLAFERALERAARQGHVVVAAAGNEGRNVDRHPQYPCAYNTGNVLCVASTNERSSLSSFSNYGAGSVHLAAPGSDILSTALHGRYVESSGTSMAVPHVAGALALLRSAFPHLGLTHLRELLLRTVRPLPGLAVSSGGTLDLGAAAKAALAATWARVIRAPASLCCGQTGVVRLELGTMAGAPQPPEGQHEAVLQLSTRANGESAEVPLQLTIRGTPELRLSRGLQRVDFGQVAVSMMARSEIVITNHGNGTAVAQPSMASGDAIFRLLQQGPFVIAPGASTTVKVSCSPQQHGLATGTVVFAYSWSRASGATMSARLTVALRAEGVAKASFGVERWSGVALLRPASLAGGLDAAPAEWHRRLAAWDAPLVAPLASPPAAQRLGCSPFRGAHGLRGRIALVERGQCYFWRKALSCQAAGAIGMLLYNDRAGEGPQAMGMPTGVEEDEVPTIPAFFISQAAGQGALQALLSGAEVVAEFRLQPLLAHVASASTKWVEVTLPISNTGGLPLTYTAKANADLFEQTGDYDVYVRDGSDGAPLPQVWHALGEDSEVQYFRGQDDASIFIEFPAPFPFFGSVVTSGWLSLNGYIVLDPDYVPSNSYVAGWIGPERTPKAIIAPYWDDLYCGTFCKVRVSMIHTAETGSTQWAAVIQFEEVGLLSSIGRDRESVTFQLVLHHDGTIDVVYRRWAASVGRRHLVVGIEGFNGHGIALHDHETTTRLPWKAAEPYSIRMLPWLLPADEAATSGSLAPGHNASLRFRARTAHGDKQGWLVVAARDSHGSFSVSRNVRVVIQTATHFALRLPEGPATCGAPVVLAVVAESAYGEVALSEERNVRLLVSDGTVVLREVLVQISRGEGNVTLTSEVSGSWILSLRDDFHTGLDCSAVRRLVWANAQVATASLEVPSVLVAGVPFSARVVFRDGFGNPAAPPADMLLPSARPLLLRWRGTASSSGSREIPYGSAGHEVQLQFAAGRAELWLDVPGDSGGLSWRRAINVTVMPRLGEYIVGTWGTCSTICGAGHRQRQVTCSALDAATDASIACRGLVRPEAREPCAGSCLRGTCISRAGSGRECACAVGFGGTTCDAFIGCPSGTSVIRNSSSDALPERCEGIQCSTPFASRFLHVGMTNGGRFPADAHFTCAKGYSLTGPANATCLSDGSWDLGGGAQLPRCQGPEPKNVSCPHGLRCVIAIRGSALSQRSQLALVRGAQACRLTQDARQGATVLAAGEVADSGTEQAFVVDASSADGGAQLTPGRYAMCWARDSAAAAEAQHALVGVLTLTGPLPASLVCVLGVPCRLDLRGVGLSAAANRVWLNTGSSCSAGAHLRFDGWSAAGPRILAVDGGSQALNVSWGTAIAGAVGQRGSLCWSSEEGQRAVALGHFTMEGPVQDTAHDCALGGPCSLTVEGQGLSLDDRIVLTVASSCPASPAALGQINTTNGVDALLRQGRAARFDLGIFFNVPQVQQNDPSLSAHTLCWIASGEQSATFVRVGKVQFAGPYMQANAVCTLGADCSVQLVGRGFGSQNIVQLAFAEAATGSRCLEARYAQGARVEGGRPEDLAKGIFRFGVPTEEQVGTYSICWAPNALASSIPAGQLELRGPRPEDRVCELGRSCRLVVRGVGLSEANRIELRLDSDCGGPASGELGDLAGPRSGTGDARPDSMSYDLGVLRAGLVGQRHVLCWRPDPASAGVVAGTLLLQASLHYLDSAAADGLDVQFSVTSSCRINALSFDPRQPAVQAALVTALAALQGVSNTDVTLKTAFLHRLLREEAVEGRKLAGGATISFATAAGSREGAQLIAQRLAAAVPGTASLTSFLWRLDLELPSARVAGATFLEPRVEVLVRHRAQGGGDGGEENRAPFDWLPWWPSNVEEWILAGAFILLFLFALVLTPLAACHCVALCRKRPGNARRPPPARPGSRVLTGPLPGSPLRRIAMPPASAPQVYGRRSVTPLPVATVAQQNSAVMRMLDMGFGYEPGLAALRRHNFDVNMAVTDLTQQNTQP